MPDETIEKRWWEDVWPLILKSPVALFSLIMTFLMGYGISFLIFDYRANPKSFSHILHIALGTGYACLIFVLTCWPIINKPLTLADIATYSPRTMIISFAILIPVMIVVMVRRERKKK